MLKMELAGAGDGDHADADCAGSRIGAVCEKCVATDFLGLDSRG